MNSRFDTTALFSILNEKLSNYEPSLIEEGIVKYCIASYFSKSISCQDIEVWNILDILKSEALDTSLETIVELFESLLDDDNINKNGIVFTPKYIADYIVSNTLSEIKEWSEDITIIDPGCGCGIFLIAAAEYLHNRFGIDIDTVIEKNIYGIDIDGDNVRRCKLVLKLLSAKYGGKYDKINGNVKQLDSLKNNWAECFSRDSIDYIIGNPPYVNPHDLDKKTAEYLKKTFETTQTGTYNIFYAFIEQSMNLLSKEGKLGFILPNNFFNIKSARILREYLMKKKCISRLIDFGDNLVFRPVRTYNCIMFLSQIEHDSIEYSLVSQTDNIKENLSILPMRIIPITQLEVDGWKLVSNSTYNNLKKIEAQDIHIDKWIRTGIATLRDNVYYVSKDSDGYYKIFDGVKYYLESDLVRPIFKIPEVTTEDALDDVKRYIIFPYVKKDGTYKLIDENTFSSCYPKTYECLLRNRKELDSRDKGKGATGGWYAYGRTQGLNKYGQKLIFPTFANKPNFLMVPDEDVLFVNGYAVFSNDVLDLPVLQKILNSKIMEYYVNNTSYPIEGGYYCYQKKFIENFTIPSFSKEELDFIRKSPKNEVDAFLWKAYNLE